MGGRAEDPSPGAEGAPRLEAADLEALKRLAGPSGWSDDPVRIAPRLEEWRGRYHGRTPLLLVPNGVEEISRLLAFCAERSIPLVPQGGNTGLVGGQIPQGEVLLSLERLNRVRAVDLEDDVLVIEAGATLAAAHAAAAEHNRAFPLSLASEGSCTIGGLVSTNAGGVAVLRYGPMRSLVLGLEAVLADGRIHNGLKRLRKNATGLELSQVLIGAEGTLGVITAASLKLFAVLNDRACALVGLDAPEAAVSLLSLARERSGDAVEAFEIISRTGVELAVRNIPGVRDPLASPHPYLVLIEIAYAKGSLAETVLADILEAGLERGLVRDAAVAAGARGRSAFWALREGQSAAQKGEGRPWKHDVATPISRIGDFIRLASEAVLKLEPEGRIVAFGHIGDGNIHFDVLRPERGGDERHDGLREIAARAVHAIAAELGGTISAEHGLGVMKSTEALAFKPSEEVQAYRALRNSLDPGRILNPRVLF